MYASTQKQNLSTHLSLLPTAMYSTCADLSRVLVTITSDEQTFNSSQTTRQLLKLKCNTEHHKDVISLTQHQQNSFTNNSSQITAPLKLRPYGAIQICFLYYYYYC